MARAKSTILTPQDKKAVTDDLRTKAAAAKAVVKTLNDTNDAAEKAHTKAMKEHAAKIAKITKDAAAATKAATKDQDALAKARAKAVATHQKAASAAQKTADKAISQLVAINPPKASPAAAAAPAVKLVAAA